jgi:predicted lipoprotein with Yx(FWY)xxD motif
MEENVRTLVASAAGAVMAGLMLAACGSSGPGSSAPQSSPPEASASPAASAPEGGAATVSLKSISGIEDEALVGPDGKTLYLFEKDAGGTSACTGECANDWPPVTVSGMPTAGSGLDKSMLGTIKRADGTTQVTYGGHPLYYYEADTSAGTAKGEGVKAFGAEWYVLNAKGAKIENDES